MYILLIVLFVIVYTAGLAASQWFVTKKTVEDLFTPWACLSVGVYVSGLIVFLLFFGIWGLAWWFFHSLVYYCVIGLWIAKKVISSCIAES